MREAGAFWKEVFPPLEVPTLRILSHGGGVQTSTLLLMSHRSEIDRVDAAIISDTGNEQQEVWDYLAYASALTDIPVYRVSNGDIIEHIRRSKAEPDGKQVVNRSGTDRYGRTLATLSVNGRDAGRYLVSMGLARVWR